MHTLTIAPILAIAQTYNIQNRTYIHTSTSTYTQRKCLRLCVRYPLTLHRHSTITPSVHHLWHLQPSTTYLLPPLAPSVCIPTGRPMSECLCGYRLLVCPSPPHPPDLRLSRSYFACPCLSTPRRQPPSALTSRCTGQCPRTDTHPSPKLSCEPSPSARKYGALCQPVDTQGGACARAHALSPTNLAII